MRSSVFRVLLSAVVAWQTFTAASGCEGAECVGIKGSGRPDQHSEFLNRFNEMNPTADQQLHRDPGAVLPFIGLTGSAKQSRNCCKNGGTCILGSFCACPKHFTGRSCEYDERARNCGVIPHGEWVQKGCSYCRCGYGVLHCFPEVFHGDCDDSQEVRWFRSAASRTLWTGSLLCLALLLSFLL
ncbi:teratocarcinoma-derived growth factor 1 [Astyanax mexicanus]|uniref:Cryptic protein-like n=2 Tax=Astyanax mexicanus TaxID=7994 RepID=A0A8T2KVW1_ASTMX|nr:teratocarcinoma-derived growth factor 1 [Astyanax mexicanus]KAG9263034.1 cryptic protein-like [Astyanax mexicanus]